MLRDRRVMIAHARLRVYYFRSNCLKYVLLYDTGNICSKFDEKRSTNNVTILSTDAGRTDGWMDVYVILYSLQCYAINNNNNNNHVGLYCK